jgi:hypothetical protein
VIVEMDKIRGSLGSGTREEWSLGESPRACNTKQYTVDDPYQDRKLYRSWWREYRQLFLDCAAEG